jgi:general secretion pathway protein L
MLLVVLILVMIAVGLPLWQQAALDDLEERVAAARAEAEEGLAVRERLDRLTRRARFLIVEKSRRPMATKVLVELTRRVPDQAHIVQLDLSDGRVQLHGYATAASDLIGLLDRSTLFKNPQFRSPVIQDPRSGSERFHLSVEIVARGDG